MKIAHVGNKLAKIHVRMRRQCAFDVFIERTPDISTIINDCHYSMVRRGGEEEFLQGNTDN